MATRGWDPRGLNCHAMQMAGDLTTPPRHTPTFLIKNRPHYHNHKVLKVLSILKPTGQYWLIDDQRCWVAVSGVGCHFYPSQPSPCETWSSTNDINKHPGSARQQLGGKLRSGFALYTGLRQINGWWVCQEVSIRCVHYFTPFNLRRASVFVIYATLDFEPGHTILS